MNEVIKESLTTALTDYCRDGMFPDEAADAAILALREWLEERGLVVVPKSRSDWLHEAVKDASLRAAKNGSVAPQLMYAPILWAMQDALAAAPDALKGEG